MFALLFDKALDDKCSSFIDGLDLVLYNLVRYPSKCREEIPLVKLGDDLEYNID
jgi:hypothetical protein